MSLKNILAALLTAKNDTSLPEATETPSGRSGSLGKSVTYSLLSICLVAAILYTLQSILVPILFAIILAVTLFPLCNILEKWRFSRALASLTALAVALLVLAGFGYLFVSQTINIGRDASDIVDKIQQVISRGEVWVSETFGLSRTDIAARVNEQLNKATPQLGTAISGFFGSIGSIVSLGILVPLMIFFFLYYRDFFREFFVRACYSSSREKVETTLSRIYTALKNYLGGMISVMGIVAVLNAGGLLIIGVEHAWFFGILASLLMLLPYIGIAIGSVLPALFALATKDSYWYAVAVIGWFQVVQILEGNFITPNIVGGKISLNPLVSILSLFFFSLLFGFAGIILALPLMAILKVIFDTVPELQPYGFLLSEPGKKYLLTARQRKKQPVQALNPTSQTSPESASRETPEEPGNDIK